MRAVAFDKALNLFAVLYIIVQALVATAACRKILSVQSLSFFMSELQ